MAEDPIPLVNLGAQYRSLKPKIDAAIQSVIEDCAFIGGERVSRFAAGFAGAIGARHCVPVANGTDAIYVTLKAMGIGPGDEVITVANSWISTSETISQTGASPVFVDIDEFFLINTQKIESSVTKKTKAIVPVHLYGQPADMQAVMSIAEKYGLKVVEDCAQAHLATFDGQTVGTFGDAATFSFYPGKNLGAYGDAGAIVTNDAALAEHCKMFANHGALIKHQHLMEGINSRLDGIQAAILTTKLPYLSGWTQARQELALAYDERLKGVSGISVPRRRAGASHVYHLYVIRARNRDGLAAHLRDSGIGCAIHYPTPLPLLPAYKSLGLSPKDFPNAYAASKEILSLPMYPELERADINRVGGAIESFYR